MEELVICQNDITRRVHSELFNLPDSSYIVSYNLKTDLLKLSGRGILKVHLALNWEGLLKIISWSDILSYGFIKNALSRAGLDERELKEMEGADPLSLFYWLYYGRNFQVLRKLCIHARSSAEEHVRGVRFECHLISEEISRIVASTL